MKVEKLSSKVGSLNSDWESIFPTPNKPQNPIQSDSTHLCL